MLGKRWTWLLFVVLALVVAVGAASCGGKKKSASSGKKTVLAALVSDIGKFNDRSFNQSQLEGLKRAHSELGVKMLPLQSNSTSDYTPNFTSAARKHANITIAAGFLLADTWRPSPTSSRTRSSRSPTTARKARPPASPGACSRRTTRT